MNGAALQRGDMSPLDRELLELQERYPQAVMTAIGGQMLITIPNVRLPGGWNVAASTLWFAVPAGYPYANPDCFYVESGVRLANGGIPQNAQHQDVPGVGQLLWFSYHVGRPWKPGRDRLITWAATIIGRLQEAR